MSKIPAWLLTVIIFAVILVAGIAVVYPMLKNQRTLKIYQPSDINPLLVDLSLREKNKDHRIADFELINQEGRTITQKDFEGKIYVADFFFATCPSICPIMSGHIAELQKVFAQEEGVMFLSHSVTPELDSVAVLAEYGERYGANPTRWMLATGEKRQIYELARKSYFAVLDEGDGGVQDFIHTENFILVDTQRRIRGFYDGTSQKEMERLTDDIILLLQEEEKTD